MIPRSPLNSFFLWSALSVGTEHNFFEQRQLIPCASDVVDILIFLRYQPPFKTGIFQNLRFCDDRIRLLKSVLLKKNSLKIFCFCAKLLGAKVFSMLIILITR